MSNYDAGHLVSLEEAMLAEEPMSNENYTSGVISDIGNALWSYHNEGTIRGIPVADDAVGLPIDRDDSLDVYFQLKRTPCFKLLWMSPDKEDDEATKTYNKLLEAQAEGRLVIIEEAKQYDMTKSKFMVWIRYDELVYELNPRFAYLREELNNG
jgi:hypothetical protein